MHVVAALRPGRPVRPARPDRPLTVARPASAVRDLVIARYTRDSSVYLVCLDANGDELVDYWHPDLESALLQASDEFGVTPRDWVTRRG